MKAYAVHDLSTLKRFIQQFNHCGTNYKTLDEFFEDNPDAVEVVADWIEENLTEQDDENEKEEEADNE